VLAAAGRRRAALDDTIAGSDVDCKLIRMSGRQVVATMAKQDD
jgi:hypothetical protein